MDTFDGILRPLNISAEEPAGNKLSGLTFAVKDLFAIKGYTTGFGNPDWLRTHTVETEHAWVIKQILDQGAHLFAAVCTDELAFSLDGINIHYGTPLNSQLPDCLPGGSSSGPAAVVAAGLMDFALGSDTAGSIRVPASYCGLWSLRPTYGAISLEGALPLGPSFDTVGILAASAETLLLVAECLIAGESAEEEEEEEEEDGAQPPAVPDKLIIIDECFDMLDSSLTPHIMAEVNRLGQKFSAVENVKKLSHKFELATLVENFAIIRGFEAWRCHGKWIEEVNPLMADSVKERFLQCKEVTAEQCEEARLVHEAFKEFLSETLGDHSVLCLPTTVSLPPLIDSSADALQKNRAANMLLSSIASFGGLPQITMPYVTGNPKVSAGLSLIGGANQEIAILRMLARASQPDGV
jgi:amidase